ncbi:proteasome maturation protein [Flavobacteriaceae bacterium]|nr:proteasome maturation protein [Flavobacteriaceae bacterium]
MIHEQIDKNINYNTLRRIYGLAKPVKTRKDTLDVLSQYIGYTSYLPLRE